MPSPQTPPVRPAPQGRSIRPPQMRVNPYDRISAGMIAVVLGLGIVVAVVFSWWSSSRPPRPEILVPLEMMTGRGGVPDGIPGESLQVDSPADPSDDASPVDAQVNEVSVDSSVEVLQMQASDSVAAVAEFGARQANDTLMSQTGETSGAGGQPGSSIGTGRRRGLGNGPGPGGGGIPNDQRWFIRFADEVSLDHYANQLDFFGIELGALFPDGKLIYLKQLKNSVPDARTVMTGGQESRLYMTWQGGSRKEADLNLFKKANIDASNALIFHFYPQQTEQMLLQQEINFAGRKPIEIQRTYFGVVPKGSGFEFSVIRQTDIRR
ncbi:hypothetical protein [Planctomicrobium sp. SH527]|uniref:hypothetical protein n=1 Tax=Planctomicrobium sp. SH527 TaxID=3448123 RepID=UPI003F5B9656